MGRAAGLLVAALLVVTMGGCSSDSSADGPSSPAARVTQSPVQEALAAGLTKENPARAELVTAEETTLTPVEAPWLRGWQVLDVQSFAEYPQRFYAALGDNGTALVLSGSPDSFNLMVRGAGVQVGDASRATDVAIVYLNVTRSFERYSYRIDALAEVQWRPEFDAAQQQRRDALETQYAGLVQPPTAEPSGTGWAVTAWMVDDRTLVHHRLTIDADGVVHDIADVVATDLPVPATF